MQRLQKGDLVRVADNLGPMMRFHESGVDALVVASYAEQFGGNDTETYTLFIKNRGRVSWYYGHQLTLVERGRIDMLELWTQQIKAEVALYSDLDWIFEHGSDVLEHKYGASCEALFRCVSEESMWGRCGEGFVWAENAGIILAASEPFLRSGDKAGWLEACRVAKDRM